MSEQWADVEGYEGIYQVSNLGRVRSLHPTVLKPQNAKGYRRVSLSVKGKGTKLVTVHELVARAFIGQRPEGYEINHKDGNRANNAKSNLEYLTHGENIADSIRRCGPRHQGETTHFAKLSSNDVIQIRHLRKQGLTYKEIAMNFNTKQANVWHICAGHTWKHLLS